MGGQQIGRQTPALSQMIERSSASQETVSKHYQAAVKKTKQTKKTDFWLLVSDPDLQTARPPASAGVFRVFSRTTGAAQLSDTPKGKKVEP